MNLHRKISGLVFGMVLLSAGNLAIAQNAPTGASTLSALSALPIASALEESAASAKASAQVPLAFSEAGATLVVRAVDASANATVYVLERVSDGTRASIRVSRTVAGNVSVAVGTSVLVSAHAAGTILTASGKVLAFVPNAVGHALLHNEQVTQ